MSSDFLKLRHMISVSSSGPSGMFSLSLMPFLKTRYFFFLTSNMQNSQFSLAGPSASTMLSLFSEACEQVCEHRLGMRNVRFCVHGTRHAGFGIELLCSVDGVSAHKRVFRYEPAVVDVWNLLFDKRVSFVVSSSSYINVIAILKICENMS